LVIVAEPLTLVRFSQSAQAGVGASAPVIKPAAAKPLVHLSEGNFKRTAVMRRLMMPSRRSDLDLRPLMATTSL
jgi:hypothetical protein